MLAKPENRNAPVPNTVFQEKFDKKRNSEYNESINCIRDHNAQEIQQDFLQGLFTLNNVIQVVWRNLW